MELNRVLVQTRKYLHTNEMKDEPTIITYQADTACRDFQIACTGEADCKMITVNTKPEHGTWEVEQGMGKLHSLVWLKMFKV